MNYEIEIAGTDVRFTCSEGQTVLDAALQAGIEMPHSCRKGVCGNCAGGIARGEVRCPPSDVAPAGQRLLCQCVPLGDLSIEPSAWRRAVPTTRKTYTVRVFRNTRVADDVNLLQLRLPSGKRAKFRAGQYLQILLPDGSRRSYSMANPPHESDTLQLHIRHLPGGRFTQIVPTLASGDTLQVELPFGSFELKEASEAPMVCVAGGTGFAPVKSLLDDMARQGARRPVTLLWGGRDRQGLYLMSAVERWRSRWPDFRFIAAVEDAADAAQLHAFPGRVDDALRQHVPTLEGHEVYCCGAPPMVAAVKAVCTGRLGLDAKHFFSDVFAPGPALPSPEAASASPAGATAALFE
jgi:CDP-4-dehydro-6-deoxyglucose reductase/terephthalate 1,2-dioxygenase reductase component